LTFETWEIGRRPGDAQPPLPQPRGQTSLAGAPEATLLCAGRCGSTTGGTMRELEPRQVGSLTRPHEKRGDTRFTEIYPGGHESSQDALKDIHAGRIVCSTPLLRAGLHKAQANLANFPAKAPGKPGTPSPHPGHPRPGSEAWIYQGWHPKPGHPRKPLCRGSWQLPLSRHNPPASPADFPLGARC
jgi:hypothetical protein